MTHSAISAMLNSYVCKSDKDCSNALREIMQSVALLALATLAANAFWLLPVAHFTINNVEHTTESIQNLISTPETQLMNAGFGNLREIALFKGYWFEYTDRTSDGLTYLLEPW